MRLLYGRFCMGLTQIAALSIVAAGLASAQGTGAPKFDAVSVKPNNSGSGSSSDYDRAGSFIATNESLKTLVRSAFDLKTYELAAPAWMDDVRFDVIARFPAGTTRPDVLKMKQAMLVERFGLVSHAESRDLPVFVLTVAKGGIRFKVSKPEELPGSDANGRDGNHSLRATKINMEKLCATLSRYLGRPLLDMTHLAETYDVALQWSEESAQPENIAPAAPGLSTAIEAQLGLKLKSQKSPIQVMVVDRAEKVPTDN
jgi:uncharacterized protein (TIGR03435 family)